MAMRKGQSKYKIQDKKVAKKLKLASSKMSSSAPTPEEHKLQDTSAHTSAIDPVANAAESNTSPTIITPTPKFSTPASSGERGTTTNTAPSTSVQAVVDSKALMPVAPDDDPVEPVADSWDSGANNWGDAYDDTNPSTADPFAIPNDQCATQGSENGELGIDAHVVDDAPKEIARPKQERVYEPIVTKNSYVAINGNVYGLPHQCELKNNNATNAPVWEVAFKQLEPSLRAKVMISGRIKRAMNPVAADNPTANKMYRFHLAAYAMDITEFTVQLPGSYTLPEYFQARDTFQQVGKKDPSDPELDEPSIALVTIRMPASHIDFVHHLVPELEDKNAQAKLVKMFQDIREIKASDSNLTIEILWEFRPCRINGEIDFNDADEEYDSILYNFGQRVVSDKLEDPINLWFKNSPNAFQLQRGNIKSPEERPAFVTPGLTLKKDKTVRDAKELLVQLAYSATDEYLYGQGLAVEWGAHLFSAVFQAVPGSKFPDVGNENDNGLHRAYKVTLFPSSEDHGLDRPKPGDWFQIAMPFVVPDPPAPIGRRKEAKVFFTNADPNDDGIDEDGKDWVQVRDTAQNKEDRAQEDYLAWLKLSNKNWHAIVLPPGDLHVPGTFSLLAYRPFDKMYQGLDHIPRVGTVIPEAEIRFKDVSRHHEYILKDAPKTLDIQVTPSVSDQTYKDIIRGINACLVRTGDVMQPDADLKDHIHSLLVNRNLDQPYPELDFKERCHPDLLEWADEVLTPKQRQVFINSLQVTHGIMLDQGVPASGKTLQAMLAAVAYASKPVIGDAKHQQVLWVTDTNKLASDTAKGLAKLSRSLGQDLTIIRVHSLEHEADRFESIWIKYEIPDHFKEDVAAQSYLIEQMLDNAAHTHHLERKAGDKRFDPETNVLDLNQAVRKWLKNNASDEQVIQLFTLLKYARANPDDDTLDWPKLNELIKWALSETIQDAHILLPTIAVSLQQAFHSKCNPGFIVKDEDPKSPPQNFVALAGQYKPEAWMIIGDPKQKGVHMQCDHSTDFPAPFMNTSKYTVHEILSDMGMSINAYMVQHRMFHPKFVKFLSEHYYNNAMEDGNIRKLTEPKVRFVENLFSAMFHLKKNSNIAMVLVENARSSKENGGTSTENASMFEIAKQYCLQVKKELDEMLNAPVEDRAFDPVGFTVGIYSPYLGVVNPFSNWITNVLKDKRFSAWSGEVVQGLEFDLGLKVMPNTKLNEWTGDEKTNLVLDTRWRYGYAGIYTTTSLDPTTYEFEHEGQLAGFRPTHNHYAFFSWAKRHDVLVTVDGPNVDRCFKCGQVGHDKTECTDKRPKCRNCGLIGHFDDKCKEPRTCGPEEVPDSVICTKCGKGGHRKRNCPEPNPCKLCGNTDHLKKDCPQRECKACGQQGHIKNDLDCPNYKGCKRCGGNHSSKICNGTPAQGKTRAELSASKVIDTQNMMQMKTDQIAQHRSAFPGLYKIKKDEEENEVEIEESSAERGVRIVKKIVRGAGDTKFGSILAHHMANVPKTEKDEALMLAYAESRFLAAYEKENQGVPAEHHLVGGMSEKDIRAVFSSPNAFGFVNMLAGGIKSNALPYPWGVGNSYHADTRDVHLKAYIFSKPPQSERAIVNNMDLVVLVNPPAVDGQNMFGAWVWKNKQDQTVLSWKIGHQTTYDKFPVNAIYYCEDMVDSVLSRSQAEAIIAQAIEAIENLDVPAWEKDGGGGFEEEISVEAAASTTATENGDSGRGFPPVDGAGGW